MEEEITQMPQTPQTPQTPTEATQPLASAAEPAETPTAATLSNETCAQPEAVIHEPKPETAKSETIPSEPIMANTPAETVSVDLQALLAQAEERGYLRGRNEQIAALMRQPGMFGSPATNSAAPESPSVAAAASDVMILNTQRVSIWDK